MSHNLFLYYFLSTVAFIFLVNSFTSQYNKLHVIVKTEVFKKQCVRCTEYVNFCTPRIYTNNYINDMEDTRCVKTCINFENTTCYDGHMYFYHNNKNICNMCVFVNNYNYTYVIDFHRQQNITKDIALNSNGKCIGFFSYKTYIGYIFCAIAIFLMACVCIGMYYIHPI